MVASGMALRLLAAAAMLDLAVAMRKKPAMPRTELAARPTKAEVEAPAVAAAGALVEETFNASRAAELAAAYNEAEALTYAHYARASYCTACSLAAWSCGDACSAVGTRRPIVIGPGRQHAVQGFVAELPEAGAGGPQCVVSFRGSDNIDNWLANLKFIMTAWNPDGKCPGCNVHTGFREAYEELESQMYSALDRLGCQSTAVTGHSLGGAVAALATFRLRTHRGMKANPVYLYGTPRQGDGTWAAAFAATATDGQPAAWRIIQHLDPVPRVPPHYLGFRHYPTEVYYSPDRWLPSLIKNGDQYRVCSDTNGEDADCAQKHCDLFSLCLPYTLHHLTQLGQSFFNVAMGPDCSSTSHCAQGGLLEAEAAAAGEAGSSSKDAVAVPAQP